MFFVSILVAVLLSISTAFLLLTPTVKNIGMTFGLALVPLFLLKPEWYFIFFIIFRPAADLPIRYGAGGSQFSGMLVLFLLAVCLKDLVIKKEYIHQVFHNSFLRIFNAFYGLFLFFAALSFMNTENMGTSINDFIRFLSVGIAVNYAVVAFPEWQRDIRKYLGLIVGASLIPAFLGLYQFVSNTGIHVGGFNRIFGTFAHCNVYAQFLALLLFCLIYLLTFCSSERKYFFYYAAATLIAVFSFYNTFTRTLWIGFGVSFLFYILLKKGIKEKFCYLSAIFLCSLVALPKIMDRFTDLSSHGASGRNSWQWRVDLWLDWIQNIRKDIFFGHGLGMFQEDAGAMAHNDFLRLSYEVGMGGAVSFYGLILFLMFYSLKLARRCPVPLLQERGHIAFCILLTLFFSSMGVNTLRSTLIMFYYLTTIAVLLASITTRTSHENIIG